MAKQFQSKHMFGYRVVYDNDDKPMFAVSALRPSEYAAACEGAIDVRVLDSSGEWMHVPLYVDVNED